MPQVEFNENQFAGQQRFMQRKTPPLVNLVMKMGAKTEKQANTVLLVVAIAAVALMVFVLYGQFGGGRTAGPVGPIPGANGIPGGMPGAQPPRQ